MTSLDDSDREVSSVDEKEGDGDDNVIVTPGPESDPDVILCDMLP